MKDNDKEKMTKKIRERKKRREKEKETGRSSAANKPKQLKQRLMDGWVHLSNLSPFMSMTSGGLSSE